MKIKVCGVTLPEDAARAAAAGVDIIGINLWPRSKRYVEPSRVSAIATAAVTAMRSVQIAGVFVDATTDDIAAVAQHLDIIQLHGDESPAAVAEVARVTERAVWKALSANALDRIADYDVDAILIDTPTPGRGGSGETFDWTIARAARDRHHARRFVLAGGLRPDNVAAAIAAVQPWAVDVASGVESAPGIKDPEKVAALIAAVRTGPTSP